MLENDEEYFFDVEEIEGLIDYYIQTNNSKKAMKAISFGKSQHPLSTILMVRHAQVLSAAGKAREALKILDQVETVEPFNIDLLYGKANIYSHLRDSEKAIEYYLKAMDLSSEDDMEDILMNLAFEYETINNYKYALKYFKEVLKYNKDSEAAIYEISFCYEVLGKSEEAVAFYHAFLDEHPYSAPAWFSLGLLKSKEEQYAEAIEAYDFAIAINDEFGSAHFNKGNALSNAGKYRKAIVSYLEAIKLEENDASAYYYIGECYEKLEEYNHALPYYQRSVKLDPLYADAWIGMAMIYGFTDRYRAGLHYINKAIEIEPDNEEFYFLLGDFQLKLGYNEEAILAYKKVLKLDPDNDDIYKELSEAYLGYEGIDAAITVINAGIDHQPANISLLYRLAALLIKKGDQKNAKEFLITAFGQDRDGIKEMYEYNKELEFHPIVREIAENY